MENFSHWLNRNYLERPEKIAIHFGTGEIWTFSQLYRAVSSLAAFLRRNFGQGERIALALGNYPEFLIAYLAIMRVGMVVVPLCVTIQKEELEYYLANSESICLIANSRITGIFGQIPSHSTPVKKLIVVNREGMTFHWQGISESMAAISELGDEIVPVSSETLAQISYTAAMDGYAKGVMLSHGNLSANCTMNVIIAGAVEQDHYISVLPLFHTYGVMVSCMAPLSVGATVYLRPCFGVRDFLKSLEQYAITVIIGVPAIFASVVLHQSFDKSCFRTVRLMISGGAALKREISRKYRDQGLEIKEGYGLTECAPSVSANPLYGVNKLGSIGLPLQGVMLKIIDASGRESGANEEGELLVKGALVMKGYWKEPRLTAQTIEDDWLHTGDLATRDEDGYYYITGRIKHMIITGGFNVYPKELTRLLGKHPKIETIEFTGVPDLVYGELVKAIIHLKPGSDLTEREFIAYAKENVADYKVPRIVEIHV